MFKIISLDELVEEEAVTRPCILYFSGKRNFIFIVEKSGNASVTVVKKLELQASLANHVDLKTG